MPFNFFLCGLKHFFFPAQNQFWPESFSQNPGMMKFESRKKFAWAITCAISEIPAESHKNFAEFSRLLHRFQTLGAKTN